MDKTTQLLREVTESKANLEQLARMKKVFDANTNNGAHNLKIKFSVTGYNDCYATCISEKIFFKAIAAAIEEENKIMETKFKTVEAIEMLSANQVGE